MSNKKYKVMKYTEKFLGGYLTLDDKDIRNLGKSSFKEAIKIIFCCILYMFILFSLVFLFSWLLKFI